MRSVLIVLLLILFYNPSSALDKVVINSEPLWLHGINPNLDKKPDSRHISNGYYLELVDRQVNLFTSTEYSHFIRHIVNETGVQNASEVSVNFSPDYQQVIFHKVNIIRNGVVVSQLKPSQVKVVQEETDASDFQYNGVKRAFVVLKDVRQGDRIEVAYSVTGFNPVFSNHYSDKIYFTAGTYICNYFETLIAPVDRSIHFTRFNNAAPPAEELHGNQKVYHWSNPELKIWESESATPSWYDIYPYVAVSEFSTWKDVVDWGLNTLQHYAYPLPEDLKQQMAQWRRSSGGDREAFAEKAIRFVQDEVRYLGLEIGRYTHKPHAPADVYHQLYGDCKDKALLL